MLEAERSSLIGCLGPEKPITSVSSGIRPQRQLRSLLPARTYHRFSFALNNFWSNAVGKFFFCLTMQLLIRSRVRYMSHSQGRSFPGDQRHRADKCQTRCDRATPCGSCQSSGFECKTSVRRLRGSRKDNAKLKQRYKMQRSVSSLGKKCANLTISC